MKRNKLRLRRLKQMNRVANKTQKSLGLTETDYARNPLLKLSGMLYAHIDGIAKYEKNKSIVEIMDEKR